MYYRTCTNCGANLDPDERCDCIRKITKIQKAAFREKGSERNKSILSHNTTDAAIVIKLEDTRAI